MKLFQWTCLCLWVGVGAFAQTAAFEVASIKPAAPSAGGVLRFGESEGRIHYTSVSLSELLARAYGIRDIAIDGPAWRDTERYDLDATLPHGAGKAQVPEMLRGLIDERFRLKSHRITKAVNGYELRQRDSGGGRGGLKRSDAAGPAWQRGIVMRQNELDAHRTDMDSFCGFLSKVLDAPVANGSGLAGEYDFRLTFSFEELPGPQKMHPTYGNGATSQAVMDPAPTIFDAVHSIGLTLEHRSISARRLVVDNVLHVPLGN